MFDTLRRNRASTGRSRRTGIRPPASRGATARRTGSRAPFPGGGGAGAPGGAGAGHVGTRLVRCPFAAAREEHGGAVCFVHGSIPIPPGRAVRGPPTRWIPVELRGCDVPSGRSAGCGGPRSHPVMSHPVMPYQVMPYPSRARADAGA